jgi:putative ABC transport system ATP-binding protein
MYRNGNESFIELRDVKKDYQTGPVQFSALQKVNLRIDAGEFAAIIGRSGSGKTTLLNMITGIDRPSSGDVLVGDTSLNRLSEGKMAVWRGNTIGIVFQFFQLFPTLTVLENIILPMDFCNKFHRRLRRERAMNLLEQVEMTEQAHKLPSTLSGGQQQRVAIARALANDPPILVADEPTGNLDSKSAATVFNLFETLIGQGKTILMVTHDQEMASRITRAIYISDGMIQKDTKASFQTDDNEQRNYLSRTAQFEKILFPVRER